MIRLLLAFFLGISGVFPKIGKALSMAGSKAGKILLPKQTPVSELISEKPSELDISNLETTPMDEFDVMGQDIYTVDLKEWRLEISGGIKNSLELTYEEILQLPPIEKNVLLICPGFFAYVGLWKGVSLSKFLTNAILPADATHVKISGPEGIRRKTEEFTLKEVTADKIFLAYQVNGQPLPERHGFPIRLVAEDHFGGQWVKYVDKIAVIVTDAVNQSYGSALS
ncbi:MAG: molybdopterin-dependent oxidoreductase [Proteobacteria bacterium]|nr:molybdopterin-dependent oxidoreductase [Pseudomonadota bacterium]